MKLVIKALSIVAVCLVSSGVVAQETGSEVKGRSYIEPCARARALLGSLSLTAEQKTPVADTVKGYYQSLSASRDALALAQKELFQTVNFPEVYSEQNVRSDYQNYSALVEERVVVDAEAMAELRTILSEEQYNKMIRGKTNLFLCARAPLKIFNTFFNGFVASNRTR
jgi:hypothetical protein